MFLPRWLRAAVWPRTVVPLSAKAKARIRDGGEAYHGALVVFRLADEQQLHSSPVYKGLPSTFVGIVPVALT